jgi:hypothetical protein
MNYISGILEGTYNAACKVATAAYSAGSGVATAVYSAGSGVATAAYSAGSVAASAIFNVASGAANTTYNGLCLVASQGLKMDYISGIFENTYNAASKVATAACSVGSETVSAVYSVGSETVSAAYSAGSGAASVICNLASGAATAACSAGSEAASAICNVASAAANTAYNGLCLVASQGLKNLKGVRALNKLSNSDIGSYPQLIKDAIKIKNFYNTSSASLFFSLGFRLLKINESVKDVSNGSLTNTIANIGIKFFGYDLTVQDIAKKFKKWLPILEPSLKIIAVLEIAARALVGYLPAFFLDLTLMVNNPDKGFFHVKQNKGLILNIIDSWKIYNLEKSSKG